MRFLTDRCAGRKLAAWLSAQGHDVVHMGDMGRDPGDEATLQMAAAEKRILVTIDTDFGALVFRDAAPHGGIVRLPDVSADQRIAIMAQLVIRHATAMEAGAVITVRGNRVRITRSEAPPN